MLTADWLAKHKPVWERLEALLARRSPRRLAPAELAELGGLYRQAASDLARLRADPAGEVYAEPLNRVLGVAHNFIYARPRGRGNALLRWYTVEYPRVFRAAWGCFLLAVGIMAAGGIAGWISTLRDPDFAARIVGPSILNTIAHHQMWTQSVLAMQPAASSGIMTNNIAVSTSAFATGIFAGLGTVYFLFFNGLLLGTIASACAANQMSLSLWSFVAPHGALELPAICIAGAAGFRLAQGLLFPSCWSRSESLRRRGGEAVKLWLGILPLLILAGVLEAYVSPSGLPVAVKFLTGAILFSLLASSLLLASRQGER